jgi:transposase
MQRNGDGKYGLAAKSMSRVYEFKSVRQQRFVKTLRYDLEAVEGAVTQPWSNGPVEGHINRLKTLRRQMYGRADVPLLRARLLPLPTEAVAR